MAITSAGVFVSPAAHATKQRWNATGSSLARMMPNWSCDGVPLPNHVAEVVLARTVAGGAGDDRQRQEALLANGRRGCEPMIRGPSQTRAFC